jgi:BMFP domain-containing protein YqiC
MSDLEQRLRNAFRILFFYQHKTRKEIAEIEKRLEELEQQLSNLYRIGDN